ncbi:MAG: PAS domain-containing sensor histidine kinase [Actinomycetota bacterium]
MSHSLAVKLRMLSMGRFAIAHAVIGVTGLTAGLLANQLVLAIIATLIGGLVLHSASQAGQRRRTETVDHRYRTLVEELPAALYIVSLDMTSTAFYVSPAIVDLLGYELDEWLGKPQLFDEILHPLDRDDVLKAIAASKELGTPHEAEYRLFHKNGSIVWVRDRAMTVRDARNRPLHWQGILADVTERKHAEIRYRALAEQLPLITYIDSPYSADEAAAYVSPQVVDILGYSIAEWQTDPEFFVDHLHPEDRQRVREAQHVARESGEPLEVEYRFLAKDGRFVWLLDSQTVVRDDAGKPWYTQGYALDITARKQAEAGREMQLRQEQLQNERLRELDRMKDEFIALVSHELRTPLTSIRGYLELLLDEAASFEQAHTDWLSVIDRNSERLLCLVEDLLLKAQVNAGKVALSIKEIDVTAIVEHSVQTGAPVATARGITLVASGGAVSPVSADPVRLGQVIDNLISNALKFTPAGGRVEARASERNGRARIEIVDTGKGIAATEQEHLFERFFRTAQAQTDAVPGVGLGLSIAKAIIEAHGGTISCESIEGAGTTFAIELPLAAQVAVVAAA